MNEEEYTRLFVPYDFASISGDTEGFAESLTIPADQLRNLQIEDLSITTGTKLDEITDLINKKLDEQANKIYDILKSLDRIEITREEWMSLLGEDR